MLHPSAAASRVLQRPSGDSMLAAVSMARVEGSRVSSAAVIMPRLHLPSFSMAPAKDIADKEDEHAVSMLTDGPTGNARSDESIS